MNRRHSLNYIYFGLLFVLLALVHILHVSLVEQGTELNRVFYMIYAIGQCLVEVGALVLIGAWIGEKFPRFAKGVFIVGTFVLLLMHLVDFPLMRIMDMSIWYSFSIVFAESFDNFVELLRASNVQLTSWLLMGVGVVVLVMIGIFLFRITDRLSSKKPLYFSYGAASFFTLSVVAALTFFDYQIATIASAEKDAPFLKALPWKTTLLTGSYPRWNLPQSLPSKPGESWYKAKLEELDVMAVKKPNIYLFIAESIREDFITEETAPALVHFRNKELSFPRAVSGANATPYSWFSIFHSSYPFSWTDRKPKAWSLGSLPLQLLKKAGYKIHVLSASRLNFYQMDEILFGKNQNLADEFKVFADEENENHVFDVRCVDHLLQQMALAEEGHLFIVFLEGTHFDYSWPPHLKLPLRPFSKAIDYLQLTYSKDDLEGIKNRYRHAIYHIDQQFNRFLTALDAHPRQDEAVVVFTSDHGEEFFEEGRIFHASNLNAAQTRVPLYYRIPDQKAVGSFTTHLDIFPTLLEYVLGKVEPWFEGESIFHPRQKNFAISTRYNASRTPYEFLITTEDELLVTRFEKRMNIKASKALEIVSRKTQDQQLLDTSSTELQKKYQEIINTLFN